MVLTLCCGCLSLRTGSLAIGVTYLSISCLVLLAWTAFLLERAIAMRFDYYWDLLYIYFGLLVVCVPNIVTNSLLIHGLRHNRRKFLFPWVIWYGVFKALVTLAWLAAAAWALWMCFAWNGLGTTQAVVANLVIWIPGLVGMTVMWYWYACVVTYFQILAPSDVYAMTNI
ncbi:hypothetical protein FJT64_009614 [Amphibalanus amphitrite]|uniref:DUF7027 domain-containing protein n=1 Tax=Amphibalanus amphitrite TaxID=1232801 RepID=A0A6A4V822_AMPAM|nr:hypothetical protein FJT64_009614 [Amphibalanus amphitrite]